MSHPLLEFHARNALRRDMRKDGLSHRKIAEAMDKWDRHTIEDASTQVPGAEDALQVLMGSLEPIASAGGATVVAADGTFFQKIIDFLNSPIGQLIIQIIKSLLLAV